MKSRTIVCYLGGICRRLEPLERIYGRFPSVDPWRCFAGVPNLGKPLYREKTVCPKTHKTAIYGLWTTQEGRNTHLNKASFFYWNPFISLILVAVPTVWILIDKFRDTARMKSTSALWSQKLRAKWLLLRLIDAENLVGFMSMFNIHRNVHRRTGFKLDFNFSKPVSGFTFSFKFALALR